MAVKLFPVRPMKSGSGELGGSVGPLKKGLEELRASSRASSLSRVVEGFRGLLESLVGVSVFVMRMSVSVSCVCPVERGSGELGGSIVVGEVCGDIAAIASQHLTQLRGVLEG